MAYRTMRLAWPWTVYLAVASIPLLAGFSTSVQAIPAYARQTGSVCADCHLAAYGPGLTPFGMRFKLNGFTDTDGEGFKIPLAAQLTETHTVPATGDSSTHLTEADLYVAGRLGMHIGGFIKVEADHTGAGTYNTKLSNVDLRYVVQDLKLAGHDLTVGVSVNNNPSAEDPVAALPAPAYLGPPGATGTLLNPSSPNSLANRVVGADLYGFYDSRWYGELGSYQSLSTTRQDRLGYAIPGDPGKLHDTAYVRLAYMRDLKRQFFSIGAVALTTKRQLPRTAPADDLTDLGYDLTYQYLGNRDHIVQVAYVDILERRRFGSTPIISGIPAKPRGSVHDRTLTANYIFRQRFGITLAHLTSTGSHDAARYGPDGNPDATSDLFSLFWVPFGKDGSALSNANLKLAASWFRFTRFNGRRSNIFGAPPGSHPTKASDLDAFFVSASLAF